MMSQKTKMIIIIITKQHKQDVHFQKFRNERKEGGSQESGG